jgi:hypothetical protein
MLTFADHHAQVPGQDRCHYCEGFLPECRVIGGGRREPKHFCSYECFANWKAKDLGR